MMRRSLRGQLAKRLSLLEKDWRSTAAMPPIPPKPPEAGIAVPAIPPRGPLPLSGGAEAPLEFDRD